MELLAARKANCELTRLLVANASERCPAPRIKKSKKIYSQMKKHGERDDV